MCDLTFYKTTDETTTGSIKTTDAEKRVFAARSHRINLKNAKFKGNKKGKKREKGITYNPVLK